ncbi:2-nitropropane dioxygenase [Thiohalorhabdus denitrificans]|uniref:Nitronate monooxygenase n=1 Tax=Thiohalorhabdus denitrificans TaxID=381306 RepID=A0A0P9GMP9_9GAMM|nr:nitronate monooxygenase family protein [Thiohalorhabdus denitrificans]KPV41667.1 2-nitropropane dioxygenase [Thiohalorhabdus denitrificans]SCY56116.1 nitronate monooxygenase [Thiohalorhabdus denitrificans]
MIDHAFPALRIRGRNLLPIIQGGMGVGVSAHNLAGTVAAEGAVGTIASVDLRQLHPDLLAADKRSRDVDAYTASNLVAIDREIRAAREIAGSEGFIAVNVMRALRDYAEQVRQACASGANAIIMGAGLPLELPALTADYPDVALIPIVSDGRALRITLKRWKRQNRLPDAVVVENPRYAGGHLGIASVGDEKDPRYDYPTVLPEVRATLAEFGEEAARIPVIAAGGINGPARLAEVMELGASGAQVGTPFAVSAEGDAHPNFKQVLLGADPASDTTTFISAAGLPARAVRTPWLDRYLGLEEDLLNRASPETAVCPTFVECLSHCGFKDGKPAAGQFCIETRLAAAQKGKVSQGLFFRGGASLPFGDQIRPVRDILCHLLDATIPQEPAIATP